VNVGYEFWSDSVRLTSGSNAAVKDQIKYAFGIEWEANPRATLVIDVLGRHLKGGGRARYETLQNVFGPGTSLQALAAIPEGITAVSVAPGIKLNMWKNVLATGNILLSVRNDGLRARATPVLGLDWSF
jgi:hypothetical protein